MFVSAVQARNINTAAEREHDSEGLVIMEARLGVTMLINAENQ